MAHGKSSYHVLPLLVGPWRGRERLRAPGVDKGPAGELRRGTWNGVSCPNTGWAYLVSYARRTPVTDCHIPYRATSHATLCAAGAVSDVIGNLCAPLVVVVLVL
jgi:hypothetical protein